MNDFEDQLSQALRRIEPPAGFADRVSIRVGHRLGFWRRLRNALRQPAFAWAAAAAVVLVVAGGSEVQRQRQERIRGEHAKQQVMLALKITAEELQVTQRKIQELYPSR